VFESAYGTRLRKMATMFPHKGCFHRFISYALAQKHRMVIRGENLGALEQGLEILDEKADNLVMADLRGVGPFAVKGDDAKYVCVGDLQFEAGVFVKKARKMVRERLSKATSRRGLMAKYGYDVKFGSNLIHLLHEGIEILRTGRLAFPLPYAQDILDIKQGKYTAEEILAWSDRLEAEARMEFERTTLREKPEAEAVEKFVMQEVMGWAHSSGRLCA